MRSFIVRFFILGLLFPGLASAVTLSVSIVTPVNSAFVDTSMPVVATTQSTYSIVSVTGTIAGKTIPFSFSQAAYKCGSMMCPGWTATADLTGVTPGAYLLVVTAQDAMGNSANSSISVTYDPKPIIVVRKPVPYAVATPTIALDLSCNDNNTGCGLSVRASDSSNAFGSVVLSGTDSVTGVVNLQQYLGQTALLKVSATDSAGQVVAQTLSIPVVDASRLTLQASVPGRIFDVTADRVLYLDDTVSPQLLKIRTIATGVDTTIYSAPTGKPVKGFLYTNGAMFMDMPGDVLTTRIYDWRNGTLVDVAPATQWLWPDSSNFIVNGQYAMWSGRGINDVTGNSIGFLRNLSTGVDQQISTIIANTSNSVSASGMVAYWSSASNYNIFIWRNGVSTQITNGGGTLWNVYPITDGTNVVFKQVTPCCTNQTHKIMLWNGSSLTVLADMGSNDPNPPQNYAIANGYVAYTKPDNSAVLQVWRHLPTGTEEQLTFFSSNSTIDSITDTGAVTITNGGELYVYQVGGTLVDLGAGLGTRLWLNGSLYDIVGGSAFTTNLAATVITKTSQIIGTISFSPATFNVGGTSTVTATGGASGNPVTFTSTTPAVCTITGSTVTGIATGTCTIAADQAGNSSYSAAAQATQSITVGKASQTIGTIFFKPAPLAVGGITTVYATATSGLAVSFSSTTPGICTVSGSTVTGIAAGTCIIAADQAGNGNYNAAPQLMPYIPVGGTPPLLLVPSWNLLGNSVNAPLTVATTFNDTTKVSTVWKWIPATSKWAFYTPSLADGGAAYAATKGYDFLTTINGGEGFWVNAKAAFAAQLPTGTAVTTISFQDQIDPAQNKLLTGWNLIAVGDNVTPSVFNHWLSVTPPVQGVIPLNVTTLWAWDSALLNWYFYAPSLEANGTLASYITGKNYLNFGVKTLDPAMGFWVNKP